MEDMELKQSNNGQNSSEESGFRLLQKQEQDDQNACHNKHSTHPNVGAEKRIERNQNKSEIGCFYQIVALIHRQVAVVYEVSYLNGIQPFICPSATAACGNFRVWIRKDEWRMQQRQKHDYDNRVVFG